MHSFHPSFSRRSCAQRAHCLVDSSVSLWVRPSTHRGVGRHNGPQGQKGADLAFARDSHAHGTTIGALGQVSGHPRAEARHTEMTCPELSHPRGGGSHGLSAFRWFLQTFGAECTRAQQWALCSVPEHSQGPSFLPPSAHHPSLKGPARAGG